MTEISPYSVNNLDDKFAYKNLAKTTTTFQNITTKNSKDLNIFIFYVIIVTHSQFFHCVISILLVQVEVSIQIIFYRLKVNKSTCSVLVNLNYAFTATRKGGMNSTENCFRIFVFQFYFNNL